MERTKLEVRLGDNTLSMNNKKLDLDASLFDARYFNKDDVDYLELEYQSLEEDFVEDEASKIYSLLEEEGLERRIEVSPCPRSLENDYPIVALFGEFDVDVYDKYNNKIGV